MSLFGGLFNRFVGNIKRRDHVMAVGPASFNRVFAGDSLTLYGYAVISAYNDLNSFALVNLPNNATVINTILYGSTTAINWKFMRTNVTDSTSNDMTAVGSAGTAENIIRGDVIDNENYAYFFYAYNLNLGDIIYGAQINFVTRGDDNA